MACHARKKCVASKTLASAVNLNVVAESEGGQWMTVVHFFLANDVANVSKVSYYC